MAGFLGAERGLKLLSLSTLADVPQQPAPADGERWRLVTSGRGEPLGWRDTEGPDGDRAPLLPVRPLRDGDSLLAALDESLASPAGLVARVDADGVLTGVTERDRIHEHAGRRRAEASRADAGRAEAGRADGGRAEASRTEAGRAEAGRADGGQADTSRTEAGRTEAGRTDAGRADGGRTDAGWAETGQAEADRADAGRTNADRADAPGNAPGSAPEADDVPDVTA